MEPMKQTILHIVEWWNPDEQRWEVQNSNPTSFEAAQKVAKHWSEKYPFHEVRVRSFSVWSSMGWITHRPNTSLIPDVVIREQETIRNIQREKSNGSD